MINNKMVIDQLINHKKGRSTWIRAVNDYAINRSGKSAMARLPIGDIHH